MEILTEGAFAKLNLTLDVLRRREDGYHDLRMIVQTISLHDDVILHVETGEPWAVHCYREELDPQNPEGETVLVSDGYPQDERNLVWKAARLLFDRIGKEPDGMEIFLNKRIPMQAGLGGGSADAAAVLRALNRYYGNPLSIPALCELGFQAGCDVAFCVLMGTALVEGRGELLTKLPDAPEMFFVVCKPDFSVSTPELYEKIDGKAIARRPDQKAMMANLQKGDLLGIGGSMVNVFEPLVMEQHFDINYIKSVMFTYGAYGAQMTGTGSAVFGIFDSFEYATVACTMLKDRYPQVFMATNV
jgi:4-diphosphocytidyl-2-C-methyl-D-erythritol kinase